MRTLRISRDAYGWHAEFDDPNNMQRRQLMAFGETALQYSIRTAINMIASCVMQADAIEVDVEPCGAAGQMLLDALTVIWGVHWNATVVIPGVGTLSRGHIEQAHGSAPKIVDAIRLRELAASIATSAIYDAAKEDDHEN